MISIRTVRNLYHGINAHLHSRLQAQGEWPGFHMAYLVELVKALQKQVRPLGYVASSEESLQIRYDDQHIGTVRADIAAYDVAAIETLSTDAESLAERIVQQPLADLLLVDADRTTYRAVSIRKADDGGMRPVAWLELLSPSNKRGRARQQYQEKRQDALRGGTVFVELDYLHATPPTFPTLQRVTYPYRIAVLDPRPDWTQGSGHIQQFQVHEPIPQMRIPLWGSDAIVCDFDAAYQRVFADMFYGDRVDYSQLPGQFDSYTLPQQTIILNLMLAIIEAAERGEDLEHFQVTPKDLSLGAAFTAWQQHTTHG